MCMPRKVLIQNILLYMAVITIVSCSSSGQESNKDWKIYGGGNTRIQYSALTEIDTNNVNQLKVAWVYHTNDAEANSQMEVNSIIVDGVLYGVSPKLKLFAIDPASGKEKMGI